ncbi:MAG: GDSL-type esterase/lipase family protein [Bacteroidota bacterium]
MQTQNRLREPFLIVLITVIVLTFLSFIPTEFRVGQYQMKKVDLFSEVRHQSKHIVFPLPDVVFADAIRDSLARVLREKELYGIASFSKDTLGAMDRFYMALLQTKKAKKKTRIAYFGDSMVEGDLLTMDLRSFFQQDFGGSGVGFVPITSIVAGFRTTIIHSFSSDWTDYNFNDGGGPDHPLGPSGHCFLASGGSYVKYKGSKYSGSFNQVKLYYGSGKADCRVNVTTDAGTSEVALSESKAVNEAVLNSSPTAAISMSFSCPGVNIYGASFEGPSGVYVDNYAFRGNSGLTLTAVPMNIYRGFDEYFSYDLIVLHYGLNAVGHKVKSYAWYFDAFKKVVEHISASYPSASILIIGMSDKGYKEGGEWKTEPDIPVFVEQQKKLARETGVAFWNLYENMGGYNSMKEWVEGDTAYANRDYAHPNHRGATRMAKMLYKKIMDGFKEYEAKLE